MGTFFHKKGLFLLKQSPKMTYNKSLYRSYMQLPQKQLYRVPQGSSPGHPRGLFCSRDCPGSPRVTPGLPWSSCL